MRNVLILLLAVLMVGAPAIAKDKSVTTRKERRAIMAGNKLYKESKFAESAKQYRIALKENPASVVATYNLGLSQLRQAAAKGVKEEESKKLTQEGVQAMEAVQKVGGEHPLLASRAAYNMGNVAFNSQDYQGAIANYKQSLRFDPNNNDARRNLRIAQKKQQNQDKNKDKNKDKKQDNKQDKNKDKDKDKQKEQDKQDQDKKEDRNQPTPNNQISEQTADQILKAMENKEAQTRARVLNPQNQNQNNRRTSSGKNW